MRCHLLLAEELRSGKRRSPSTSICREGSRRSGSRCLARRPGNRPLLGASVLQAHGMRLKRRWCEPGEEKLWPPSLLLIVSARRAGGTVTPD
jgi:hypothetical protein